MEENISKVGGNECSNQVEQKVEKIAKIILIVGCVLGVLALFGFFSVISGNEKESALGEIFSTLGFSIFSVISWAILKILCNISNSLKDINNKMK